MKSLILIASMLGVAVTSATADPIADRKAQMKARGALVGTLAPIAKGEQPFDAAKVMDTLQKLSANAQTDIAAMWPAGSEAGDTTSAPKIWEDAGSYKAAVDKYQADVDAAVAANPQDLDAFRASFGAITSNCGTCHQDFRVKKG